MHTKLRSTLTSLSVAVGFVAGTLMLAQPLASDAVSVADVATSDSALAPQTVAAAVPQRERHSARVNLAMPYYSFARLLPRRES